MLWFNKLIILFDFILVFFLSLPVFGQNFNFSGDFSRTTDLIIKGTTSLTNNGAILTNPKESLAKGLILYKNPVNIDRFNNSFTFQLPQGSTGTIKSCIWATNIAHKHTENRVNDINAEDECDVSISLNTFNYNITKEKGNTVIPGNNLSLSIREEILGSVSLSPFGIDLRSGHIFRVDLRYYNLNLDITVTDQQTGISAFANYPINLPKEVGDMGGLIGFVGDPYGLQSPTPQKLLTWNYDAPSPIIYSVIDLGILPGKDICSAANISETGEVVGECGKNFAPPNLDLRKDAFIWNDLSEIKNLGSLINGGSQTPTSINNNSIVVGSADYSLAGKDFHPFHAFVWNSQNGLVDLGAFSGDNRSIAVSINNKGIIAGNSGTNSDKPPFIGPTYSQSKMILWKPDPEGKYHIKNLGRLPGYSDCRSIKVFEDNSVLGVCTKNGISPTIVLWSPIEGMVDIGSATEHKFVSVAGSNEQGDFVGIVQTQRSRAAAAWINNQIKLLGLMPNTIATHPNAINDRGQVVGFATGSGSSNPAFIYDSIQGLKDLNTLLDASGAGWFLENARSINNQGWIVGHGLLNRVPHAFILKPANVAQIYTNRLHFQTGGQSLWSPGQGSFNFDLPLVTQWDTGNIGFDRYYNPSAFGFHLGDFGIGANIGSSGKTGFLFHAFADGGTVNIDYPVFVKIRFPDKDSIFAGDNIHVCSEYSIDPAATLTTTTPSARAFLNAILESRANVVLNAKAFGGTIFNFGPSYNINENRFLFDTDKELGNIQSKNFDIGNKGILTGHVHKPNLVSSGGVFYQTGGLVANGSDRFLSARGNITNLLTELFGIQFHVGDSKDIPGGKISYDINLLQLSYQGNFTLAQNLQFNAKPKIHLDFSDGRPPIEFEAGKCIDLKMPSSPNDPSIGITPSFTLPNQFINDTSVVVDRSLNFAPLEINANANAYNYNLGSIDFKPGQVNQPQGTDTFTLFHKSFEIRNLPAVKMPGFMVTGKLHAAPTLVSLSQNSTKMFIVNDNRQEPDSFRQFHDFVNKNLLVKINGSNFQKIGTQAFFSYYGAKIPLHVIYHNSGTIQVSIPQKLFLIPGVGRISVETLNSLGSSNSLDFKIEYPTPKINLAGPFIWASDPDLGHTTLNISGENFIDRPDYYLSPLPPTCQVGCNRFLQKFWNIEFPDKTLPKIFTEFDFTAAAPMPTVFWNNQPLQQYAEPVPSGFTPSLLPRESFAISQIALVKVVNPGDEVSESYPALIGAPRPVLKNLEPNIIEPGSSSFRLVVKGLSEIPQNAHDPLNPEAKGFVGNSVVYWNGQPRPTTFVSATELQADISESDVVNGQVINVIVRNPSINQNGSVGYFDSTPLILTIKNPVPETKSLYPASAFVSDPGFQGEPLYNLTVRGSGFTPGSRVFWNGQARVTRYLSKEQLEATILPTDVARVGENNVSVLNTSPGGGSSNSQIFTVIENNLAKPAINTIIPNEKLAGDSSFTLVLQGSNFAPNSVVQWNGSPRQTHFQSNFTLTAEIPSTDISSAGMAEIKVTNPNTGGMSEVIKFKVSMPLESQSNLLRIFDVKDYFFDILFSKSR